MKAIAICVAMLLPIAANAGIAGAYTCTGNMKSVVKANGKTSRPSASSTTQLNLFPDGSAQSINPISPYPSDGAWSSKGARVFLSFDQNDLITNALYGCQLAGATCTYIGGTYNYPLTANKPQNVLKGVWKLNLTMLINGMLVNNNSTINVTCRK